MSDAEIVAVAAAIFVAQNRATADVTFLFFGAKVPLSLVISIVLGALLGWIAGLIRRRRKRRDERTRLEK